MGSNMKEVDGRTLKKEQKMLQEDKLFTQNSIFVLKSHSFKPLTVEKKQRGAEI